MTVIPCTDINNAFARCLINTLLNLASAALQALKALLQQELAILEILIAELMMQLLQYDVLAQAEKAFADKLRTELDRITNLLNGLPLGLLDKACLEWANLNGGINGLIQNEIRPPIEAILYDLNRILSFREELNDLVSEYQALKQLLLDVIDLLDILILEAKCRESNTQP